MDLYGQLLLIRRSEERLSRLFADGEVPGFIHLSIGQEAVPVGVMSALTARDTIASTHRGHGHAIAKGLPLDGFFLELLARDEGLCRGRGTALRHVPAIRGRSRRAAAPWQWRGHDRDGSRRWCPAPSAHSLRRPARPPGLCSGE